MRRFFLRLPIFRRLFVAFLLAALIPDIIILGIYLQITQNHIISMSDMNSLLIELIVAMLISSSIVFTFGYLVHLTITRPLMSLVALTRRIGRGETNARAHIEGRDEISVVSISINTMLDNIVKLIYETQNQRDILQQRIERLIDEVSAVGNGDLRVRARETTKELGILANFFNYIINQLSTLIIGVKSMAQQVQYSTISVVHRMETLVTNADRQIRQIHMAVTQVEQMANSSQQITTYVHTLDENASETTAIVQAGRNTVQQTIRGLEYIQENVQRTSTRVAQLGKSSQEIDDFVQLIANIAHQTNRLALDAAIQASMAGANGAGFREVADDIRRLAEQTKAETSRVTNLVSSVRSDIASVATSMQESEDETRSGTERIHQTGETLETIFASIEQQARETGQINQRLQTFLQTADTVANLMRGISKSTQESSESVRQTALEMNQLTVQARQLLGYVSAFKLREENGSFV